MPISIKSSPKFQVLAGPFEVPTVKTASKIVDAAQARQKLSGESNGERVGCYIFAVRKGKRLQPWYVGKATKSFAQEVFNPVNCYKYGLALGLAATGKPVVFLIAAPRGRGAVNKKAIDKLENMLVEECGGQNPKILNQRKTQIYRTVIHGVVNSGQGKPSAGALAVRRMMGRA